MTITIEQRDQLIDQLLSGKFPLTSKYFGSHLKRLLQALVENGFEGRFVKAAFSPESLENLLKRIELFGQTKAVVKEIGDTKSPVELDKRAMNAWAELRTISQLAKENFTDIQKISRIADLTAHREAKFYVFQVTRISTPLQAKVEKINSPGQKSGMPYGALDDIHLRLDDPTSYLFWNTLESKNGKFKKWSEPTDIRCIVIVSSDYNLQDQMVRHIACQQLARWAHALQVRHFEELLWLPDLGNGAWFTIGSKLEETQCFVDWSDEPDQMISRRDTVHRRVTDLCSDSPV